MAVTRPNPLGSPNGSRHGGTAGPLRDPAGNSSGDEANEAQSPGKRIEAKSEVVHKGVLANGLMAYLKSSLSELFLGSWMNIMFVFTPLAILSDNLGWGRGCTFMLAVVALVPFGERLGWVTEDFVKYTNETAGGLFVASVGNLSEIIFCYNCMGAGLLRVVQVSMVGSVLSNLLLVLGTAFLLGGVKYTEQRFNKTAAITNAGLLVIAVLALSLPSILDATHTGSGPGGEGHALRSSGLAAAEARDLHESSVKHEAKQHLGAVVGWALQKGQAAGAGPDLVDGGDAPLWLSRFIAGLMVALYWLMIVFQFITHTHLFQGDSAEDDDLQPGILGLWPAVFWLGVITYFIWLLSELVVTCLEGAALDLGVPILFLGGVLLPVVGNAVEHASAVTFALHNKMEIALGVAVGSAVQISMFVIPLTVLVGWAIGQPMTLNFHIFETAILLLTCIACASMLGDGRAHWMKGAMLVLSYAMVGAAFWAHADPKVLT